MLRSSLRLWLPIFLTALTMGACGPQTDQEIRLGVNAELTGSKPVREIPAKKAANLLVTQINQAGGLQVGDKKLPSA
ncbi:MAG: hypothetical protein JRG72_10030 [Deltaproteobacteria bacterium]|nr:hypothetical protein [Deltaproteobacteria bacterium]